LVGGLGIASLGAAAVLFGLRQGAINELERGCSADNVCPPQLRDTKERGEMYTLLGNVGIGVGALGISLGAVLLLTGNAESTSDTGVKPGAPDSLAGLSYRGKF
jgi:hypothetical protein